MEITVIHGQMHKGNTYHAAAMLTEKLSGNGTVFNEYFLAKDTPDFCIGCFQCIMKSEYNCPQAEKTQKILSSMLQSDIIIFDSPTYCYEMTGQLKTLFDHYAYLWMPHRPNKKMFSKIGIVISTASGAGAKRTTASIAKQLFWWGVPKIHKLNFNVRSAGWENTSDKTKTRMQHKIDLTAIKVRKQLAYKKTNLKTMFLFNLMRRMQLSNSWNPADRKHWEENGWLKNERPW